MKSLFSSNPPRVKALSAPGTLSMALSPPREGQPLVEKLYVMRKESTTSPEGCNQVRAMEVEAGEAVSPVGEDGGRAAIRNEILSYVYTEG